MDKNSVKKLSDRIVSLSAIIIAVASIIVTVWQGFETRRHNRLSVRPKLEISFELKLKDNSFAYTLTNKGLGPAVITDVKFYVDGMVVQKGGFSIYDKFKEKLGLKDYKTLYTGIYPGKTIKSNEEIDIIRFFLKEKDNPRNFISRVYRRVVIEIGYKSMYGEEFTCRIPVQH